MRQGKQVLVWAVVIIGPAVLAVSPVGATGGLPSPGVGEPPRECTIDVSGGSVKIQAGPNGSGGLATDFPKPQTGGDCPEGGSCIKWEYLFTFNGLTEKTATLSVDSDITVQDCTPACSVSKLFPLLSEGERTLNYNATSNPFMASFFTPSGSGTGTQTASFVAKKGLLPRAGLCALSGADDVVTNTNLAVTTKKFDQVGQCTIERTLDGKGCTVGITVLTGNCSVSDAQLQVDNLDPIAISCDSQVTAMGSTRYCYPLSTGKMKCVTF